MGAGRGRVNALPMFDRERAPDRRMYPAVTSRAALVSRGAGGGSALPVVQKTNFSARRGGDIGHTCRSRQLGMLLARQIREMPMLL
jgi:hypothetical protein